MRWARLLAAPLAPALLIRSNMHQSTLAPFGEGAGEVGIIKIVLSVGAAAVANPVLLLRAAIGAPAGILSNTPHERSIATAQRFAYQALSARLSQR